VRVEIMGSQKCRIVGKSQPVLMMSNPMIFTRTRSCSTTLTWCCHDAEEAYCLRSVRAVIMPRNLTLRVATTFRLLPGDAQLLQLVKRAEKAVESGAVAADNLPALMQHLRPFVATPPPPPHT
jgi:hypothetical protein